MAGAGNQGGSAGGNSTTGKQGLEAELDSLKADLRRVRDDIKEMADTVVDMGRKQAKSVKSQVNTQVESGLETVQEYIEQKPVTTVLAAFGIGLLAGAIFSRK